ncbi:MAG: HD domain-containing protein [Deltaproteobacteria bacterium]|nr:HD domain-containing protein [Deltaproteobacteria bacterium]
MSKLLKLKDDLDAQEESRLSRFATLSRDGVRRSQLGPTGHRQEFALDADRILHSKAYTRYIDKTQVFYMVRNDHITHRVLHVQLVSKIARTVGRFLRLNEDLIEAIALGHDIGHPPFGHDGERELAVLCKEHGLPPFQHNVQSVQFLEHLERRGQGWDLTLHTLDGILCHDGEIHSRQLRPNRNKDFEVFDRELLEKSNNPELKLVPMTLEGCLVRICDTIAYIGRDIEDAIELKLIKRGDVPDRCRKVLGDTNGTIVYHLVEDLITNSLAEGGDNELSQDSIGFSPEVSKSLKTLKGFNYQNIYTNPAIKKDFTKIQNCYRVLFEAYVEDVEKQNRQSEIYKEKLNTMACDYLESQPAAVKARDFIAGMTDDYFLKEAALHGCEIPEKI